MRIGLVSSTIWPIIGGTQAYLYRLAGGLVQEGHSVVVAARFAERQPRHLFHRAAEAPRTYSDNGATVQIIAPDHLGRRWMQAVYRLHYRRSTEKLAARLFSLAFEATLAEALDGCDVIHYSGVGRELLGFTAARVAARRKIPLIITAHLHIGSWGDGDLDFCLYRQAAGMLTNTYLEKEFLVSRGIAGEQIAVTGSPIELTGCGDGAAFRQRHGLRGPVVLFMGRKTDFKGYPLLLEAAPRVWERMPNAQFVFIGPSAATAPSADRSLNEVAADPRVRDLPPVTEAEKEDALAACDVFCLPSQAESLGRVYVEAWGYGKPVVGLGIPTLQELIGGAEGGLLAEPTSGAVAEALISLLRDSSLRARLGESGRKEAGRYSTAAVTQRVVDVYQRAQDPSPTSDQVNRLLSSRSWLHDDKSVRTERDGLSANRLQGDDPV